MNYTLHAGNNVDVLKQYPDNHFDSVVTDPPYGIDFLGKDWDSDTGSIETYRECLRVLKPGGHLIAFSAARTYHHLAISVERAGFEIRDQIMWIYSSGFPKSQDVGRSIDRSLNKKDPKYTGSKKKGHNLAYGAAPIGGRPCGKCGKDDTHKSVCEDTECGLKYTPQTEEGKRWSGWGTALKPAHEPIVLARKPAKMSITKNVQVWGTGALNIDATRIDYEEVDTYQPGVTTKASARVDIGAQWDGSGDAADKGWTPAEGRFPSNVLGDLGEYQKYFYCPKVSRKERHVGHEDPGPLFPGADGGGNPLTQKEMLEEMGGRFEGDSMIWLPHTGLIAKKGIEDLYTKWCEEQGITKPSSGNNHPTVKPQKLMEYLIKLVTPPHGTVLDPFNGSGSTGMAAVKLGHTYVGIDLDEKYIEISRKRIEAWNEENTTYNSLFSEEE